MGWSIFSREGQAQELSVFALDVVGEDPMEQMAERQTDPAAIASKFLVVELVSLGLQIFSLAKILTNTSIIIVHTFRCVGLQSLFVLIEVYVIK